MGLYENKCHGKVDFLLLTCYFLLILTLTLSHIFHLGLNIQNLN